MSFIPTNHRGWVVGTAAGARGLALAALWAASCAAMLAARAADQIPWRGPSTAVSAATSPKEVKWRWNTLEQKTHY